MSFGVANQGGTELITSINAALDSSAVLTSLSSVVSSRIATRGPRGRGKRGFTRFGLGEFDVFDSLEIEGVTGAGSRSVSGVKDSLMVASERSS